jgi:dolichol-phosphate mannosyltransferase
MTIQYSVVIPLKNEEDNIVDLIQELEPIMLKLQQSWELICIDDGSTDKTLSILTSLLPEKKYLRLLVFKKNYGQSSAFDAGFRLARGEYVITLDGDRQNDPADIPKLLEASKNCDLVCGVRVNRKDTFTKKITSTIANYVRRNVCDDGASDTGCSLKVYRSSALKKIKMYNGMHRFLPALFKIEGLRIQEVPVNHRERTKGATKYNFFNRSFNTVADLFAVRWMKKRQLQYQINKEYP